MVSVIRALLSSDDSSVRDTLMYRSRDASYICNAKEKFKTFTHALKWVQAGSRARV